MIHRTELDSHADTCCVGNSTHIFNIYHNKSVDVTPFISTLGQIKNTQIVDAAVIYDAPDGQSYMILIHQALYFPELQNNLICLNQCRMNDIEIDDCPRFLSKNPTEKTHSIYFPEDDLRISLSLQGVTSYFPTRRPTPTEFEQLYHEAINLTSPTPDWSPHSPDFDQQETNMHTYNTTIGAASHTPILSEDIKFLTDITNTINCTATSIASTNTSTTKNTLTAERLAATWNIGLDAAKRTLNVTTQRGVRTVMHPTLKRRWHTNDRNLRYRRLPTALFTDTMKAKEKSIRGNRFAQIYVNDIHWTRLFPMVKESQAHETLSLLFKRDGVPNELISDNAKAQTKGDFRKKALDADVYCKEIEPYSPWMNAAEGAIRENKRATRRAMIKTGSPYRLWDYCAELQAKIRSNTAHDLMPLEGEVPETIVTGNTADISTICEYQWYEWIKFRDQTTTFPDDDEVLGRYLGPAPDTSPMMAMRILKQNGQVVVRSTIRHLTPDETNSDVEKKKREEFDELIKEKIGALDPSLIDDDATTPEYEPYEEEKKMPEADDFEPEAYDKYISAEVNLARGDELKHAKVLSRKRDADGNPIGRSHTNPLLDTRVYTVEFDDGETLEYAANVIAENMYSQVDTEGRQYQILESIVDHKKDGSAVSADDQYVTVNGKKHARKTTKGWKLCIKWKDGSTSWEPLKDLKESNPVEIAEYAVAHKIVHEPAFSWWVPYTLKRRERIIAAVQKRYWKMTHKFGIQLPKTIDEALQLDKENGNDIWEQAIKKEMKNIQKAFQHIEDDEAVPVGYNEIPYHCVFDVKMDFTRKCRLVAGGHVTDPPAAQTYASVVSRESVRIALTMAALNDLDILSGDIQNAYLNAPITEKVFITCGVEFGADRVGKRALVIRALYGLKSAGAAFRNHLADCMATLGFESCKADPDVWMRKATREDGFDYYEYVLIYTDDILAISHRPNEIMKLIDGYFPMKPSSIGTPDIYLGGQLSKVTMPNGVIAWSMASSKYVQNAVTNVEDWLAKHNMKLSTRAPSPMTNGYRPELDVTKELDPERANYYQSQIGVLRWAVELGRIDIITEVSMLASHLAMPREGHLTEVFHIFAYLKNKHNAALCFDPTYPDINTGDFNETGDWKNFYGDVTEAIPINAPEPRGKEVVLRCYEDSDHAGDKLTRRSRTGFIILMNMSPIMWYSKRQNTVETSTFGSEFVSMKTATEACRGLRYKLRMMGIPIDGPTYVYGDNQSVLANTSAPESTLKKKSNAIAYHFVRECVARGEILTAYVKTEDNIADICTKPMPGGEKRTRLVRMILYYI